MPAPRAPRHDHSAALAQYQRRAPYYDAELALLEPLRLEAIARLALRPGQTVLDVGCGTGLSLALLRQGVGARGHVIGIDQSPAMLERARACVRQHGWRNVRLIESSVEMAEIASPPADAALFHFTHDVLRAPLALDNVLRHLCAGAQIVACGLQWASLWAWPMNLFVLGAALHSVSSLEGLQQPWKELAERMRTLQITTALGGAVFIASGTAKEAP